MSCLIKLTNVVKTYTLPEHRVTALRGVSVSIMRGEMTAIMGASGSGKSTLMNIMGLLDRPTSGSYTFDGLDVATLPDEALARFRNQKIGFVFQSFFLLPRLTALENVMLPLHYAGVTREEARTRAETLLNKMGVLALAAHRPNQLSGGQQQRVAIARALVNHPDILLADEPTGALDSKTGSDVMALFKQLNEEGRTIVIITHDPVISAQCKRVLTIKDGTMETFKE